MNLYTTATLFTPALTPQTCMGTKRSTRQERGASSGGKPGEPADSRARSAGSQGRSTRRAAGGGGTIEAPKATAETKKRAKNSPAGGGQGPAAPAAAGGAAGLRSPTSTSRATPGGPSRTSAATSSAETGGSPRKRSKPSGGGGSAGGSASKRPRAPGILTTALGWARSQAAELAAFEQDRVAQGPIRPPPQLPLPTRRLAAAQHDMMKAMQQQQQQVRPTQGRSTRTASASAPRNVLPPMAPVPPGVHPAAVAFAAGSDAQMAAMVSTELTRLNNMAQADPQRYNALAEECRAWAAGSLPTVAGLTSADLERAQKELQAAVAVHHRGAGGAGRPSVHPDPRASSYFIQPFPEQDPLQASLRMGPAPFMPGTMPYGGGGGGGSAQRYPRRSSRGRNMKRDELYLTLDSEEDGDEMDEDDDGFEEGGDQRWGGGGAGMPPGVRRGPGRPRKHPLPHPLHSQFSRRGGTPMAPSPLGGLFMPPAGAPVLHPSDVLSPFAQFLLDQDVDADPNAGGTDTGAIATDGVDFGALDDFISGLNFTNDALLLGSPGTLAVLQVAKALSPPGTRPPGPMSAAAPGPLPAARKLLPEAQAVPAVAPPLPPAPPAGAPLQADDRTYMPPPPPLPAAVAAPSGAGPSAPAGLVAPSSVAPPPPLQILELDLAACKPLETPTLAGMLSLAGPRKASTPGTSPGTDLLKGPLLSPTLLALNF